MRETARGHVTAASSPHSTPCNVRCKGLYSPCQDKQGAVQLFRSSSCVSWSVRTRCVAHEPALSVVSVAALHVEVDMFVLLPSSASFSSLSMS